MSAVCGVVAMFAAVAIKMFHNVIVHMLLLLSLLIVGSPCCVAAIVDIWLTMRVIVVY